ncbi:hypothetical protein QC761_607730 [Podospora bellae-mahoneyi]|uniref:BTB domain-containing protein n=1 Tax=Podospora bellae-mahoneyi TaxID=2093777 RepID=A0ABR0FCR0_9PEZI|nr:hypothetical protein QC761_607730 [Podospora bellae-mahoneyi]
MDSNAPVTVDQQLALPQYNELISNPLEKITLNVGGHKFTTTINSLTTKSFLFKLLLQGDWKSSLHEDQSIFINSNPEAFRHILQYLRRGVFPLIYDQKKGHNYKLYADILAEAKHFGIPKLECWLTDQLYLRCITSSTVWSSAYKNDRIQTGFQTTSTPPRHLSLLTLPRMETRAPGGLATFLWEQCRITSRNIVGPKLVDRSGSFKDGVVTQGKLLSVTRQRPTTRDHDQQHCQYHRKEG